jgi:uncharacterized protein
MQIKRKEDFTMKQTANMKHLMIDGLILLGIAAAFVIGLDSIMKPFKKGKDIDPLVTAVTQEKIEKVKELLGEKGYQAFTNQTKKTVTMQEFLAMRTGIPDALGRTPLMWCAYVNYRLKNDPVPAVNLKVGKAAELTAWEKSDTNRVPIVAELVASGANVNARDKDGWSALMWASWSGLPKVAEKLVDNKADLTFADRRGNTALTLAVMRGNEAIVKLLTERGVVASDTDRAILKKMKEGYPSRSAIYSRIADVLDGSK